MKSATYLMAGRLALYKGYFTGTNVKPVPLHTAKTVGECICSHDHCIRHLMLSDIVQCHTRDLSIKGATYLRPASSM